VGTAPSVADPPPVVAGGNWPCWLKTTNRTPARR